MDLVFLRSFVEEIRASTCFDEDPHIGSCLEDRPDRLPYEIIVVCDHYMYHRATVNSIVVFASVLNT